MNRRIVLAIVGVLLVATGIATMDKTWLKAYLGGADSQLVLGHSYATGNGVEKNEETAATWYLKAAEQGDVRGQLAVASRYDTGLGLPLDHPQATEWYQRAAKNGASEAQLALAFRHATGEGAAKDNVQAAMWLILAGDFVVGRPEAFELRDSLQSQLSETELSEARRIASEWRAENPPPSS